MENQKSLQESLLQKHNDVVKSKRIQRSRSAPIMLCIPGETHSNNDRNTTAESLFRRMHPSVARVTTFLSIYLVVGVISFYVFYGHLIGRKTTPIVDALYFCIVTMTTVGYGDLVPQTVLSKLLACGFVFSGMALVALVLSKAADYLVEKQEKSIMTAVKMRNNLHPDVIMKEIETKKVKYKCLVTSIVLFILLVTGTIVLILVEKLDFVDAIYCVSVTVTSLGYGDRSFSTRGGRIFAIVWILTSTICLAQFFLYIAELSTERRQNDLVKWVLSQRVTIVDLEKADTDNDGVVNAADFVLYKLKEMRKISEDDISLVMKEFEELDVNQSGTLSVYDIKNA